MKSTHNSLQYDVKSQYFLRVLNSFSLHLKKHKAVFEISATHKRISLCQQNAQPCMILKTLFRIAIQHKSTGVQVVSKLKPQQKFDSLQQHKLKQKSAKIMEICYRHLFKFVTKSFMLMKHSRHFQVV